MNNPPTVTWRAGKRWFFLLLGFLVVASGLWLVGSTYESERRQDYWLKRANRLQEEAQTLEEQKLLAQQVFNDKQTSRDLDTLNAYYTFREVEMDDQECWQRGAKQVDANLMTLSNRLVATVQRLDVIRAELATVEQHLVGSQPMSK